MEIINQDILSVKTGIIGHQVNCMGVMGAGLALSIRKLYPQAYSEYKDAHRTGQLFLGNVIVSEIFPPPFFIMHMCGQLGYGRKGVFTNYDAFEGCLKKIYEFRRMYYQAFETALPMYLPYNVGCGLAGGDWMKVSNIIERVMPDTIICKI